MDEKELETLMKGISEKTKATIKSELETATAGLMKSDELAAKFEAMGLKDNVIKELTDAVEKQGEEMRKIFEGKQANAGKSIEEIVQEKAKEIQGIAKSGGRTSIKIEIPRINKTEVTRASYGSSTMAMRLNDIGQLPYLGTTMSGLFRHVQVSPSSNGIIRYIDQNAITRNAASVAESAVKPESAITWIERSLTVEKIADSIPVTKEAFADVGFIQGEIDRLLNLNLALKVDDLLYDGDGVTPNIKGVYTSAGAFTTTPYDDTVESANIYDLIAVLRVDIMNNRQGKYQANTVLMNPVDILRYKLAKTAYGYVLPPFISQDGMMIDGLKVVESSQVTANSLVVGDFRFGTIYDLEGVTVEMGWINDQFIQNTFTILAEQRLALLIRTVDETAFRKVANITTALAALETP